MFNGKKRFASPIEFGLFACMPRMYLLLVKLVIGEKASDLSTARIDQAELQKNNQDRVSDVAKNCRHRVFVEHGGARNG